jgi:hypothetical protein
MSHPTKVDFNALHDDSLRNVAMAKDDIGGQIHSEEHERNEPEEKNMNSVVNEKVVALRVMKKVVLSRMLKSPMRRKVMTKAIHLKSRRKIQKRMFTVLQMKALMLYLWDLWRLQKRSQREQVEKMKIGVFVNVAHDLKRGFSHLLVYVKHALIE